eukprot:GHVU01217323.1.p1 GENE.GHVU01217323.1~~GHVU01217323.1.p1  ORF type:complete len:157 (+),score=20.38 GHVU01217323.1:46-471(+)
MGNNLFVIFVLHVALFLAAIVHGSHHAHHDHYLHQQPKTSVRFTISGIDAKKKKKHKVEGIIVGNIVGHTADLGVNKDLISIGATSKQATVIIATTSLEPTALFNRIIAEQTAMEAELSAVDHLCSKNHCRITDTQWTTIN